MESTSLFTTPSCSNRENGSRACVAELSTPPFVSSDHLVVLSQVKKSTDLLVFTIDILAERIDPQPQRSLLAQQFRCWGQLSRPS
jgi:hypothetical protein